VLPWDRHDVLRRLVVADPFAFDAAEARRWFEPELKEARAAGRVPVVSSERLAGNPHSGGYDSRTIADRLKATFPDARVLIVIRRQADMILSCYKQFVREGGAVSLRRYARPPSSGEFRVPAFDLRFFEYHRLIGYYQDVYGPDAVLVLPFELLQRDPGAFAGRVTSFTGRPPADRIPEGAANPAPSWLATTVRRHVNFWVVRDRLNPAAPVGLPRAHRLLDRVTARLDLAVPSEWRAWGEPRLIRTAAALAAGRFSASNRVTKEMTGIELAQLGYEV
jgi:hypothetical protein